jgi:hypothetical protein
MHISKNNGGIRSCAEARQQAMQDMVDAGIKIDYFNKESLIRQLCNQENILPLSVLDSIQSIAIDRQLGDYKYESLCLLGEYKYESLCLINKKTNRPERQEPTEEIQAEFNLLTHMCNRHIKAADKLPLITRITEISKLYKGIKSQDITVPRCNSNNNGKYDYSGYNNELINDVLKLMEQYPRRPVSTKKCVNYETTYMIPRIPSSQSIQSEYNMLIAIYKRITSQLDRWWEDTPQEIYIRNKILRMQAAYPLINFTKITN